MQYKELWMFQNDNILKDKIKRDFEYIEWLIVWVSAFMEEEKYYEKWEKKALYENLSDVKINLNSDEWLNLSLVYNRLTNILNIIIPYIDTTNYNEWLNQSWHFIKLQNYIGEILKSSWINIDVLDTHINDTKNAINKIIFSK